MTKNEGGNGVARRQVRVTVRTANARAGARVTESGARFAGPQTGTKLPTKRAKFCMSRQRVISLVHKKGAYRC
jgi:hypothetical protein